MTSSDARIRFDPHVHTGASYDAVGSVHEVLSAAEDAGIDAVAITDHDTVAAASRAVDLADEYETCVVPGVEVSTADGHLLALGITDLPPLGAPIAETVAWVRDRDGLAVVPHPFQRSRHGVRKRDVPDADGIEIFNAWSMTGLQNRRARLYATRNDYPRFGGSDAHDPKMVGYAYTEVPVRRSVGRSLDPATLLEGVRSGSTTARGTTASAVEYIGKYTRSVGMKTRTTVEQTVFGAD